MRGKVAVACIAILAALSVAGVAFAKHILYAEVVSVNASTRTLTVDIQGLQWTCNVVERAHTLADLKPGDKIGIIYTESKKGRPLCHHVFPVPTGG
ncbi:MAG: hypothetical protein C3F12_09785 [Candidatus Methylomirabilota bacterium]|nr:hypothetical protein [Candidatus Methylomirabilis sp.]NJD68144.1 copper-binding protein [candidate division NC10 bacterium]PWB46318.1 MAG: hypothetical protein C3F12_09785 [candidate division NC10 bacterium]